MRADAKTRDEFLARMSGKKRRRLTWTFYRKVLLWELTVRLTYAVKRLADIILSLTGLLLLSPLFGIVAALIYIDDPGPVFYSQIRVGLNGREFRFHKFRSMVMNADKMKDQLMTENESADGVLFKMKDDPRITKIGKFIRKFSIDELPQLVNVLSGEMSLVGPRPALPREVEEYTLEERKRLHIKPGITGIWQVSGRSDIPFKEQVQLDLKYIRSQSFFRDIGLLLKTVPAILTGKGAY